MTNSEFDHRDAWIAFLLSVAMPGAGQLWMGSSWGITWLIAAASLVLFWGLVAENLGYYSALIHFGSFLMLGFLSGMHARRVAYRGKRKR